MIPIPSIFRDDRRHRLRAGWRIALGLVAMMGILGVLVSLVDAIEIPFVESFLWQVLAVPALIGLAHLLARLDRRPFGQYGLAWEPRRLGLGLLLGVGMVLTVGGALWGLGWIRVEGFLLNRYPVPFVATWGGFVLRYASVAVFEELFHRGFLITNLAEGLDAERPRRGIACAMTALLFGGLHLTNEGAGPLAGLNIGLLGLVLGLLYVRTGSLSMSVGLHFAWNLVMGPVLGMPVSGYAPRVALLQSGSIGPETWTGGAFGPEGGAMTSIVLIVVMGVVWIRVGRTRKTPDAVEVVDSWTSRVSGR